MKPERIGALPERAVLPERLAPSTAYYLLDGRCALRACASMSFPKGVSKLPRGLAAERGSIVHDVIDAVAKGGFRSRCDGAWMSFQRDGAPKSIARVAFDRVLEDREKFWGASRAKKHWVPFRETFLELEWDEFRRGAIQRAHTYARAGGSKPSSVTTRSESNGKAFFPFERGEVRTEERVESDRLRLHGKVDHLELTSSGRLLIKDHKIGRILENGTVKFQYALQLQLYALVFRELQGKPSAEVELWLEGPDGQERVDGSRATLGNVELAFEKATKSVMLGEEASLLALAKPGTESCGGCDIRHLCVKYLEWAPQSWNTQADRRWFPLPLDVWGELVRCETRPDGHRVDLRGPDRVRRQILRLRDDTGVQEVELGSTLFLFDLATSQGRVDGVYRQPRRFHEWADDPNERAWSAACYVGLSE